MTEETYQDVVDKIKAEKEEKDELPPPPPELEKSETVIETNDENETSAMTITPIA